MSTQYLLRHVASLFIGWAAVASPAASNAAADGRPFIQCEKLNSTPQGGGIEESAWQRSSLLSPFVNRYGDTYPEAQSQARVVWDAENLHILVKAFEPAMSALVVNKTDRDSGVWMDDCIEVFLQPEGATEYWHFVANAEGVQEDAYGRDTSWNGEWKSKARKTADGWQVELTIPFKDIGLAPAPGKNIRFNICRSRPSKSELSAAFNPGKSFHDASQFGTMQLVEKAALVTEVRQDREVLGESGELTLLSKGDTATFKSTLETFTEGRRVETVNGELRCIAGESHKTSFPFKVPGTKKPAVQLSLEDANGNLILRTERLPFKVGDLSKFELTRTREILASLSPKSLSPLFLTKLPAWKSELQALEEKPHAEALRNLYLQMSIARLVSDLSPEALPSKEAVWFTLPLFSSIEYHQVPQREQLAKKVTSTACRGETTATSFNVLALSDLASVTVEVGEMRSGDHQLPADAFDLSLVKYWYQAGEDNTVGSPVFVPELLVKDDSWATPDHETKRNTYQFTVDYPNVPYQKIDGPSEPDQLAPISIPAFSNRQFWLRFRVPADQPDGTYKGFLKVSSNGKNILHVPLEITILPVTMAESKAVFGMYNHYYHTAGKYPEMDIYNEKVLEICRDYGMNMLMSDEGGSVAIEDGEIKVNTDRVKNAFQLRKQLGLDRPTFQRGSNSQVPGLEAIWEMKAEELRDPENPVVKKFIAFIKQVKAEADAAGIETTVYTIDEPAYDPTGKRLEQCRIINELVQSVGLKTCTAITAPGARALGANLDLPIISMESVGVGKRKEIEGLPHAYVYYHPLEHPFHDRLHTGLVVWFNKMEGAAPYALAALGAWDDWNGQPKGWRPERYIYDAKTGPIPTLQFEGYREGVNDHKYFEMIEARLEELRKKSPQGHETLLKKAEDFINIPDKIFTGSISEVEAKATSEDFVALRLQAQKILLELDQALHSSSHKK